MTILNTNPERGGLPLHRRREPQADAAGVRAAAEPLRQPLRPLPPVLPAAAPHGTVRQAGDGHDRGVHSGQEPGMLFRDSRHCREISLLGRAVAWRRGFVNSFLTVPLLSCLPGPGDVELSENSLPNLFSKKHLAKFDDSNESKWRKLKNLT